MMKGTGLIDRATLIGLMAGMPSALVASQVVFQDEFENLGQWQDLSNAVTWSGSAGGSVFQSVAGVASLKTSGGDVGGYTTGASLKTFTALDHRFAVPINRRFQSVTVEARLKWQTVAGNAEANRFNISFVHDYPAGDLDLTPDLRMADFSQHWWGRPAYQIRIRGSNSSADGSKSILQYGGGLDIEGEWEPYRVSGIPQWWLPGFNAAPGGGSPGNAAAKGWVFSNSGLASTAWQTFSYTVGPSVQTIAVGGTTRGTQTIGTSDGNPYFNTFDSLDGLRLYWRAASADSNVEIDWLTVTVRGVVPQPVASLVNVNGEDYLAVTYRQPSGGSGAVGFDYTADGFTYTVESNEDLGALWESGAAAPVIPVGPPVEYLDGSQTVTVRLATPVSSASRQFARVKVIANP
jgi:hypothetical protein